MCWHHLILGDAGAHLKIEISFRDPLNTGFDIILIGVIPEESEKTRITQAYKSHTPLAKFRGGLIDVIFCATEEEANTEEDIGYTLTPFGGCVEQKAVKNKLAESGVTNFLHAQKPYNDGRLQKIAAKS